MVHKECHHELDENDLSRFGGEVGLFRICAFHSHLAIASLSVSQCRVLTDNIIFGPVTVQGSAVQRCAACASAKVNVLLLNWLKSKYGAQRHLPVRCACSVDDS